MKVTTPEKWLTVALFVMFTGAINLLALGQTASEGEFAWRNPQSQAEPASALALWLALYTAEFSFMFMNTDMVSHISRWSILLPAVALASALWSEAPSQTLRFAAVLALSTVSGAYIASRFTTDEILTLLAFALGVCAAASLAVGALLPDYGVMRGMQDGAWRGIYSHKNGLGRCMVLAILVFAAIARRGGRQAVSASAGIVVAGLLLVLAKSMTSLALLPVLLSLVTIRQALRAHHSTVAVLTICGVVACAVVVTLALQNPESVSKALGRDVTLTGRTILWELVIEKAGDRPILGHGYGVFWSGAGGAYIQDVVRFAAVHAHNGYLNLVIELGLLGLAVFVAGFAASSLRSLALFRAGDAAGLPSIVFLAFFSIYNLTESMIISRNNIFWVLYVIVESKTRARCRRARSQARGVLA